MLSEDDLNYLDSYNAEQQARSMAAYRVNNPEPVQPTQTMGQRLGALGKNFFQEAPARFAESMVGMGGILTGQSDFDRESGRRQRQLGMDAGNVFFKPAYVAPPTTTGEMVANVVGGGILPELPGLMMPAGAVGRGARMFGAGERTAAILGDAAAGAFSGARDSAGEAGIQAGEFGLMGAAGAFVPGARPLLRAAASGAAGAVIPLADSAIRGHDPLSRESLTQAGVMAALPFAMGARKIFGRRPVAPGAPAPMAASAAPGTPPDASGIPADWKLRTRTEMPDGTFEHVFDTPQGEQVIPHPEQIGGEPSKPYQIDPLPPMPPPLPVDFSTAPRRMLGRVPEDLGTLPAAEGDAFFGLARQKIDRDFESANSYGREQHQAEQQIREEHQQALRDQYAEESSLADSMPFPPNVELIRFRDRNGFERVGHMVESPTWVNWGEDGYHKTAIIRDAAGRDHQVKAGDADPITSPRQQASLNEPKRMLQNKAPEGLRPLPGNESGGIQSELLHSLGGGAIGAGVGYALPGNDDEKKARALTFGAIGALGGAGWRFFKRVASEEGAAAGRRTLTGIGEQTLTGKARRLGEKQFKLGQAAAVDTSKEQARGTVTTIESDAVKDLRAAMPNVQNLTTPQRDALWIFMSSDRGAGAQALLSAAALPKPVEDFAIGSTKNKGLLQHIIADALDHSDPVAAAQVRATIGSHVTEPYRVFTDNARWRREGTASEALRDQIVQENMKLPQFAGMTEDTIRADLEKYVVGLNNFDGDFSRMQNEGQTRISQSLFTPRKVLRPSIQQLLGKIHDPIEREMLTIAKLAKSAVTAKQITELMAPHSVDEKGNRLVMKRPEWQAAIDAARSAGDAAKVKFLTETFEPMPDVPGLGNMGGSNMMAQRQVMDAMAIGKGHDKSSWGDAIMKALAPLNKIPKAAHTLYNPSTHVHNLAQMLLMPAAAGMSPLGFFQHAMAIAQDAKKLRWAKEDGMMDAHLGAGEFRRTADSFDKLMNPGKLGFIGKVHNFVKTAYGIPDQLVRGAVYSKFIDEGVKKGMSEAAARRYAVENTNRYTQNYSNVAPIVDKLRNFPLVNPFISYTAEMGRIIKNLAEDVAFNKNGRRWQSAGGLATMLGLGAGINALIQSGLSPEDQEQVKQLIPLMPPYMKGKTAPIILRKDGKISSFNLNPWLPAEDFITTAKNIYNGDWDAVLANNPVAGGDRTPALNIFNEIRTGKDAIGQPSGGVLQSVQQNALPGWFPGVPGLTGPNYQAKKIVQGFTTNDQGARGITDSRGRTETPLSAIGSLFGISTATQDEQKLRERPLLDAKEAIKGEQDKLKRIFGSNVPQATKDDALIDFQDKAKRILRKAGVND